MKVIDLLNKIANGEEVPKKIKYHNDIHILQKSNSTKPLNCYYCKESYCHLFGTFYDYDLNDEVEIIEEEKENKFTGLKMFSDGKCYFSIDTSEKIKCKDDVKIEEKKIPEKIERMNCMNFIKNNFNGKYSKEGVAFDIEILRESFNEIIDYLEENK